MGGREGEEIEERKEEKEFHDKKDIEEKPRENMGELEEREKEKGSTTLKGGEEIDDPRRGGGGGVQGLYSSHFQPSTYMVQYYSTIDSEEQFFLRSLHTFFRRLQASEQAAGGPGSPRTVVELGSGPLLSGLASASAWADLLVAADLLPANLAFLR